MNAEHLLAHYDKISGTPDAIPRLRRFILNLAVRGKLVEQDPNDEPATELLKRIVDEKAQLVKAGKIPKRKQQPLRIDCPLPHLQPSNWQWVPLGSILNNNLGGGTPSKTNSEYWCGDIYWASVKDIGKGKYLDDTLDKITKKGLTNSPSNLIPAGNLIVVTRMGLGKISINRVPVAINQDLRALFLSSSVNPDYIFAFFRTQSFEGTGLTVKGIRVGELLNLPLPLPPLAEQHRIVATINELMALCDQLEVARTERETTRNRLTAATLARLNGPDPDPTTFQNHAAFALENLTPLTTRPDQINALRQTILNLAIRGKLTHQDPNEDRRNQRQLRTTVEAGRFDAREFEDRAFLFTIPVNWTIEPLSRVASHVVDCPHTTPKWTNQGVLCIKTNQVKAGYLDLTTPYFVSEDTYRARVKRLEPEQNDVLYIREGGILGVACLVPPNSRLCLGQRLMLIRTTTGLVPKFLELCLNSSWIKEFAAEKTIGGAAPRVNMSTIRGYPIPIPPLAEQYRIITKVKKLLICCNQLETNLANGDDTRSRLLDAILYNSPLAGANPRKDYVESCPTGLTTFTPRAGALPVNLSSARPIA